MSKLVFMGSDAIGLPVLRFLDALSSERARLVAVISQPDKASGRGKKLTSNPIAAYAKEHGLQLLQPEKPDMETTQWIHDEGIDLVIVMAYGHILRNHFLEAPSQGCVNLHASLLPKYRGASPIQSSIASCDHETGISLMRIIFEMDAGAVCDVETVPITEESTAASVFHALSEASVPLVERNLEAMLDGSANFIEQNHAEANYTRKLTKEDGFIDFKLSAYALSARIRAVDPWPGASFAHAGQRIKVRGVSVEVLEHTSTPGSVLEHASSGILFATGKNALRVRELQKPGGKWLAAQDFVRGYPLDIGTIVESVQAMPELVRSFK